MAISKLGLISALSILVAIAAIAISYNASPELRQFSAVKEFAASIFSRAGSALSAKSTSNMLNTESPSPTKAVKRPNDDAEFPADIEGFGYRFNDQGQLRSIDTDEPFQFEARKGDKAYNQARYDALGNAIEQHVFELLETRGNLRRVHIPEGDESGRSSFVFLSDDALTNEDKLLLLIHGTGVVRAGQWARSVIINHNLDAGTQLPYIEKAKEQGFGVIVLNTNLNSAADEDGVLGPVPGSETPEKHAQYVWKHFVRKAAAKEVYIVAHSYGGVVTVALATEMEDEVLPRVASIAFTDSVHSPSAKKAVRDWMKQRTCNWVQSKKPLDEPLPAGPDCLRVSAGTPEHVFTSHFAFRSVFQYFAKSGQTGQASDQE